MKSIIITGASSGIGKATALTFLNAGWCVGLLARRKSALEEIAADQEHAIILAADVSDAAAVERAFAQFVEKTERLDVLFNNAGIFSPAASIDKISVADWQKSVDVNLTGMFLAARQAFRVMKEQDPRGGRIINNGSVSAHVPRQGAATYTATKHGVTGLTKSISLDGRDLDIACGQIDIGNAQTELLQSIADAAVANGDMPPPMIDVQIAADAVFQMANLPLNANVQFQTIMATKMPFIGRG